MDTVTRNGQLLPQFNRVREVVRDDDRIKAILCLFYRDILDIYSVVLKFFGQSKWQVFFGALWPRCKDQIKIIESDIEKHSLLLREEVTMDRICLEHEYRVNTLDSFKKNEQFHSKQIFQTLKASINLRLYDDKLDWLRGHACKATSKWLALDDSFRQWMDISVSFGKILWLQGIPGAGKTFLAGWVVNRTITQSRRTLYAFASHVFVDTTAISIMHTLLLQLASDDPSLQTVLSQANERDLKSNTEFVKGTLKTALQAVSDKKFLVIDELDEVDNFERK